MLAQTSAKTRRSGIIAGVLQTPVAPDTTIAGIVVCPIRRANKWIEPVTAGMTQVAFSVHTIAGAVHLVFVTGKNAALRRLSSEFTMTILATVMYIYQQRICTLFISATTFALIVPSP